MAEYPAWGRACVSRALQRTASPGRKATLRDAIVFVRRKNDGEVTNAIYSAGYAHFAGLHVDCFEIETRQTFHLFNHILRVNLHGDQKMQIVGRTLTFARGFLLSYGPTKVKKAVWDNEFSGDKWNFIDDTSGDCVYPHLEKHARGGDILDLDAGPAIRLMNFPKMRTELISESTYPSQPWLKERSGRTRAAERERIALSARTS